MEPVMATTGTENFERCQAASRPRARVVSSTRTSGTLGGGSSGSVWTTTEAAPRAAASARNTWPFSRWPTIAKNASPTWRVRESIDTPATGTPRSPLTSAPWVARTSSWTRTAARRLLPPRLRQQPPRDVAVVERQHVGPDDLVRLVPLAGDDHRVAGPRPRERGGDRRTPVGEPRIAVALAPNPRDADGDLRDDRVGILGAWGVRGDPRAVGQAGRGPAPARPPGPTPGAGGGERFHPVVPADRRRGERQPARRRGHRQAHAVERRGPLAGAHTVVRAEAVAQRLEAEPRHHTGGGRVVAVHDGDAPRLRRGGEQLEEPALGAPVLLERPMEVQMVLREVREDADVEGQRVDARERQRVRADLHGHAAHAALAHGGQHRLDLERLRRRLSRRPDLVADDVLNGAEDPAGAAARAQQRVDEVGGRGLAVGARDAHQRQRARGMVPVGAGQRGEGAAR